jgi:hypothetical protein
MSFLTDFWVLFLGQIVLDFLRHFRPQTSQQGGTKPKEVNQLSRGLFVEAVFFLTGSLS